MCIDLLPFHLSRHGSSLFVLCLQVFDVVATEDPVNIAYSPVQLHFHMDLVYYESPPGLQLLHCIRPVVPFFSMHKSDQAHAIVIKDQNTVQYLCSP